jgi:DNA-binding Lrp family transcriptional regulator
LSCCSELFLEVSPERINAIGKQARLSRENVHYRIEKLKEKGIIKSFVTIIDHRRLGMRLFTLAFALHRASEKQEQEIIDTLAKHPNCSWLGPAAGSWNILVDAYVEDREALDSVLQHFMKNTRISLATTTLQKWLG